MALSLKLQSWLKASLIVLTVALLFFLFQKTGVVEKISPKNLKITFGIAFLTGVVASFSTCLALIGSVVIAFNEKYSSRGENFYQAALRPNLMFHFGRLGTFFLLGGLLGLVGKQISINANFAGFLTIAVSTVMVWLGLNILGFLPSISTVGIKMPSAFSKHWLNLEKSKNKAMPLALGSLNFFSSLRIYPKHANIRSCFRKFSFRRNKPASFRPRNPANSFSNGHNYFANKKNPFIPKSSRHFNPAVCFFEYKIRASDYQHKNPLFP